MTRGHPLSPEDYYTSRPPVFVGAAVLLADDAGGLLLVKPTYEARWVVPRGAMEDGETPRQTATREVREQLGLDRPPGGLLCVDFVPPREGRPRAGIMYLFDGGTLSGAHHKAIVLPHDELSAWRFVCASELDNYIGGLLLRRVTAGLEAQQTGRPVELENGYPVTDSHDLFGEAKPGAAARKDQSIANGLAG